MSFAEYRIPSQEASVANSIDNDQRTIRAYVETWAQDILDKVDAEKVLYYQRHPIPERIFRKEPKQSGVEYDPGELRAAIKTLGKMSETLPGSDTFEKAINALLITEQAVGVLEKWQVIGDKPLSVSKAPEVEPLDVSRCLTESLSGLYRTGYNNATYDHDRAADNPPRYQWEVNLSPEELAVFERGAKSIDVDKELHRIAIEGCDLLPYPGLESEIRAYTKQNIPPLALEGVSRIIFREKTDEERLRDLRQGAPSLGMHSFSSFDNAGQIVIYSDPYKQRINSSDQPKTKDDIFETLTHEYGHALSTVLPAALLSRWHTMAINHKEYVSPYAEYHYRRSTGDQYTEDFAESFRLYVRAPHTLVTRSQKRWGQMMEVFSYTMPRRTSVE